MNGRSLLKSRYQKYFLSVSVGMAITLNGCNHSVNAQYVSSRKVQDFPTKEIAASEGDMKFNSKLIYLMNHLQRNSSIDDINNILDVHFNLVEERNDGSENSFVLYDFQGDEHNDFKSSFSITTERSFLYPVIDFHMKSTDGECAFRISQLYEFLGNGIWKNLDYYVDDFTNGIEGERGGFSLKAWGSGGYGMNNKLNQYERDEVKNKYKRSDMCVENIEMIYLHS